MINWYKNKSIIFSTELELLYYNSNGKPTSKGAKFSIMFLASHPSFLAVDVRNQKFKRDPNADKK